MSTESDLHRKLDLLFARLDSLETLVGQLIEKHKNKPEDGPEPPDRLWLDGVRYEGFSSDEFLLLELIWGRSAVSVTEVIERIWGDDLKKDNALKKLRQRLNKKLRRKGAPLRIGQRHEKLYIEAAQPG
jgi:hypothetical protein